MAGMVDRHCWVPGTGHSERPSTSRFVRAVAGVLMATTLVACGPEPLVDDPDPGNPAVESFSPIPDGGTVALDLDDDVGSEQSDPRMLVKGTATPSAVVELLGASGGVLVDATGAWELVVNLSPGINVLRFRASLDGWDPGTAELSVELDESATGEVFSP